MEVFQFWFGWSRAYNGVTDQEKKERRVYRRKNIRMKKTEHRVSKRKNIEYATVILLKIFLTLYCVISFPLNIFWRLNAAFFTVKNQFH